MRPRRKQVDRYEGLYHTINVGCIVVAYWGGQVEGQRHRTRKGIVTRILDDGSFRAECLRSRSNFNSTIRQVVTVLK